MLQKLLQNKITIFKVSLCVLALALIRGFEAQWFYDPFLAYFKSDYLNLQFPEFESLKLLFSMAFRFMLNTFFSLLIIYFLFKDFALTKFASILYLMLFFGLICCFFIIINYFNESNNFLLFYVRRFIIQPIFLILLIPAFYFQKRAE